MTFLKRVPLTWPSAGPVVMAATMLFTVAPGPVTCGTEAWKTALTDECRGEVIITDVSETCAYLVSGFTSVMCTTSTTVHNGMVNWPHPRPIDDFAHHLTTLTPLEDELFIGYIFLYMQIYLYIFEYVCATTPSTYLAKSDEKNCCVLSPESVSSGFLFCLFQTLISITSTRSMRGGK